MSDAGRSLASYGLLKHTQLSSSVIPWTKWPWGCSFAGCALRHAAQAGMGTWHLSGLGGYRFGYRRLDTTSVLVRKTWCARWYARKWTFQRCVPALRADHIGGRPIPVLMAKTLSFSYAAYSLGMRHASAGFAGRTQTCTSSGPG